ncbi:MAG: hypothetical protein HOE90_08455 [Bacteriovoracaceae bacterium]|nr:hypothetical protein [Bacteriovoracaceae bacterium]
MKQCSNRGAFTFIFLFLVSFSAMGKETIYLQRSPRALFMGDAFTALADDEFTLFYNPAGLGFHHGFSMSAVNPKVGITNLLDDKEKFENFPENDPVAIADRVIGIPVHLELAAVPSIKMDHFGLAGFYSVNTGLGLNNKIHPTLEMDYRYDKGFVTGFAYTTGSGKPHFQKRGKPLSRGWLWSFGAGVKHISREGLAGKFNLFGTSLLNTISNGVEDYYEFRDALGYAKGSSWGVDIGSIYKVTWSEMFTLSVGFSIMDMFDTQFSVEEGTADIPDQDMMINTGMAFTQDFGLFHYTISMDLHPMNHGLEFFRMYHAGVELGLPILSLYGGYNGGNLSYGVGINLWVMKLYGGFYEVERGVDLGDESEQRGLLYLSILDFSFDA